MKIVKKKRAEKCIIERRMAGLEEELEINSMS